MLSSNTFTGRTNTTHKNSPSKAIKAICFMLYWMHLIDFLPNTLQAIVAIATLFQWFFFVCFRLLIGVVYAILPKIREFYVRRYFAVIHYKDGNWHVPCYILYPPTQIFGEYDVNANLCTFWLIRLPCVKNREIWVEVKGKVGTKIRIVPTLFQYNLLALMQCAIVS